MIADVSKFMAAAAGLLIAALLISSCTAANPGGYNDVIPPPGTPIFDAVADLPAGAMFREPSASTPADVDPLSYLLSGGLVTDQASSVLLDTEPGSSSSWVMYGYDLGGNDPQGLALELQFPNGPGGWLAIADYAANRWQWQYLDGATQPALDLMAAGGTDLVSTGGWMYFVLLSHSGADVQVTTITVSSGTVDPVPTYNDDIAPLLSGSTGEKSCTGCHGGIDPNLESYSQVSANAAAIFAAVDSGIMPPSQKWSQANIDLFQAWIDGGKPEL